eukprot:CAMPEP_0116870158 /NCGR_PEP_ID=MMETSP0463-20121206/15_1 /TAXON_ID=181622 /ORGANISM="Strombidinopsis sp, Strain SopsisLIS2011" /LENGTH=195 /DNA_ID=CAMNT_0004506313 /DNA_START=44 /DNA_END=631 /DNA_ORIENTATION=+
MSGHNCVAIATDTRLSTQLMTVDSNFQRVFKVNDKCLMGLSGLATDVQTFNALMKFKTNLYSLKEGREIKAGTFSKLVATSLYEKRFGPYFVAPVVAGLDKKSETEYEPVICTYDSIGYREHNGQFEVAGTGSELLYGVCESFYKPNLEPDQLFEVISNCLLSALDRDSLSGWGAYVYILTPNELTVRALKTRQD